MNVHKTAVLNHSPEIGDGTQIGEYTVIHGSMVSIGKNCDIGERVSINASDSHLKCIGLSKEVEYRPITILGGCKIGHHSVIGAGVIVPKGTDVPPYSLVVNKKEILAFPYESITPIIKPMYYYARVSDTE